MGLGHDFLRHIERTRVLIHLLDGAGVNPVEDWAMINQELALYDADLDRKPQLVVLNKMDLPDAVAWEPLVAEHIEAAGFPFMSISAVTGQNVREMLYRVRHMLDAVPAFRPPRADEEMVIIRPRQDEEAFTISREAEGWRVRGARIERVAAMTYWEFDATVLRFQRILESMGITEALEDAGIQSGDMVFIGDEALEWSE